MSGDRDLKEIESEAYKKIQEIEGAADAKATEIYAKAYNASPESVELFTFVKSMETLRLTITPDSTMILTTNGDLMGYLKSMDPVKAAAAAAPAPSAAVKRIISTPASRPCCIRCSRSCEWNLWTALPPRGKALGYSCPAPLLTPRPPSIRWPTPSSMFLNSRLALSASPSSVRSRRRSFLTSGR